MGIFNVEVWIIFDLETFSADYDMYSFYDPVETIAQKKLSEQHHWAFSF